MIGLGVASLPLLALLTRAGQMPAWRGRFGMAGHFGPICGIVSDSFGLALVRSKNP